MNAVTFRPQPMDQPACRPEELDESWIWNGYLARRNISLLTSRWKSGKTTLLAGLLRSLQSGGTFLDRACTKATAIVVSEELPAHWSVRQQAIPIGPHVQLVSRPFPGFPTAEGWNELTGHIEAVHATSALDLVVVDSLAAFLPGRSDSVAGPLLDLLHPLRRLAEMGIAVLILHHPRKERSEIGSKARGSGVLLGYVDVILELERLTRLSNDSCRRKLVARSRFPSTPAALVFEWKPGTSDFQVISDLPGTRFHENWEVVRRILSNRIAPATHRDVLTEWPAERPRPTPRLLYEWLSRAAAEGRVTRDGAGTRSQPYRFSLAWDSRIGEVELPKYLVDQLDWIRRGPVP